MTPEQERVVRQMEFARHELRVLMAIRLMDEFKPEGKEEIELTKKARHTLADLYLAIGGRE